jgi:hypothetical protein
MGTRFADRSRRPFDGNAQAYLGSPGFPVLGQGPSDLSFAWRAGPPFRRMGLRSSLCAGCVLGQGASGALVLACASGSLDRWHEGCDPAGIRATGWQALGWCRLRLGKTRRRHRGPSYGRQNRERAENRIMANCCITSSSPPAHYAVPGLRHAIQVRWHGENFGLAGPMLFRYAETAGPWLGEHPGVPINPRVANPRTIAVRVTTAGDRRIPVSSRVRLWSGWPLHSHLSFGHLFPAATVWIQIATLSGCGALGYCHLATAVRVGARIDFTLFQSHWFASFRLQAEASSCV